jgi:hypothetical protein
MLLLGYCKSLRLHLRPGIVLHTGNDNECPSCYNYDEANNRCSSHNDYDKASKTNMPSESTPARRQM